MTLSVRSLAWFWMVAGLSFGLTSGVRANESGLFSYSISLRHATETGSPVVWRFTSPREDGATPKWETHGDNLVFSTELAPVIPGEPEYATAFVAIEANAGIVEYGILHEGESIPDAHLAHYHLAHSHSSNSGTYRVTVSNDAGQQNSSTVSATILPPVILPMILPDPTTTGQLLVQWNSYPGQIYQLEDSSDLEAWFAVGEPMTGTGSAMEHAFDPATVLRNFFRITVTEY